MANAAITFVSVILAAALAYSAALTAWRRQQRREVYGAYIAAIDDVLDALDRLFTLQDNAEADKDEPIQARVRDPAVWQEFRQLRLKFDAAWGQVRLVAPRGLAEHARQTGHALMDFEREANDLTVDRARELRERNPFLHWEKAKAFVSAARKDLHVESTILAWYRRNIAG